MPILKGRIPKIFTSDQLHEASVKVMRAFDREYSDDNNIACLSAKSGAAMILAQLFIELGMKDPESHYEPDAELRKKNP